MSISSTPCTPSTTVRFSSDDSITDKTLESLDKEQVTDLLIDRCQKITDKGLETIGKFTNLKTLRLSNCRTIKGDGLAHLTNLKKLNTLDLEGTFIKDKHLIPLSALNNL